MNIKTCLLISAFSVFALLSKAQIRKLDQDQFKEEVINQWWSFESREVKRDCDMRIFVVKPEGFELNCINWSAGFSGNKCAYTSILKDNFFELAMINCPSKSNTAFIYGYLSETGYLFLLLRNKQLIINAELLSEKDWIMFEKIKK